MVVVKREEAAFDIGLGKRVVNLHEQLREHVEAQVVLLILGIAAVDCLEVEFVHVDFVFYLADDALCLVFLPLLLVRGSLAILQLLLLLRSVRFEAYPVFTEELFEQCELYQSLSVSVELVEQELELFVVDVLIQCLHHFIELLPLQVRVIG